MTISEKVAYLKGLADGLDLDTEKSKEGKLISVIIDILEDVGFAVEDLEVERGSPDRRRWSPWPRTSADVETALFDEDDEDEDDTLDLSDLGDDFFEIECPSCGEDIVIDESVLDIGEVTCPNCGDRFSMDLVEEPETDDGADDPQ